MAEKGILILDQTGGDSIACRDSLDVDELSNPRIVQRLSLSTGQYPDPLGAPHRALVTGIDSYDLGNLPTELLNNLVQMGDKSKISLIAEFTGGNTGSVTVVCLLFDEETPPVCHAYMSSLQIKGEDRNYNSYSKSAGSLAVGKNRLILDTFGAKQVGLHIGGVSSAGAGINVWGFAI